MQQRPMEGRKLVGNVGARYKDMTSQAKFFQAVMHHHAPVRGRTCCRLALRCGPNNVPAIASAI